MSSFDTYHYDVLVIGAGGAGLRAAIEAAANGVSVGLICKSLLGKAHTVMAEGGIAAALSNVDERDNWRVHFADTMRGGQYLNDWRMAELHAREAPDRVRELEAWGALFDRTKDGRILQRNFGGHKYPRLAHVGDRTGLEMIRTLQDHGIHQGIEVHMECTIITLLKSGEQVAGALGYEREKGQFKLFHAKAFVIATGGVGRAYKITSNMPGQNSWIWSLYNFTLPVWYGRPVFVAFWLRKAFGAKEEFCSTGRSNDLCLTTFLNYTASKPPTMRKKAGNIPRATGWQNDHRNCLPAIMWRVV
jgi:aspartate oxidase